MRPQSTSATYVTESRRVLDERHEAADAAIEIVVADVEKYLDDQRARGAAAIVSEVREYFDDIVATRTRSARNGVGRTQ